MTTDVAAAPVLGVERRTVAAGLGRVTAALAVASAAVHVLGVDASSLATLVMAGLALTCLLCGWHLWTRPTVTAWAFTAALDISMLAVHFPPLVRAARGHLPGDATAHAHPDQLMLVALVLVTASLVLSALALNAAARARDGRTGTTR